MSGSQQLLLGGAAPTVTPVDPYFYSVTSLLHGDGTNGGQNNTFLDSSSNNFTITRNGNTTQGSFSPFSQTGWGWYFGGSSDWINFASSSSLAFASDFTVEAWVYNNFTSGTFNPAVLYDSSSNALSSFEINNGTNFPSVAGITGLNTVTRFTFSGPSVALSQWVHVAWVRSSGVLRVYVNGIASSSTLSNSATTGQFVQVGNARSSGSPWNGYISNLRIVSSAVYTSNFTPSSTPLTAISGTQLLTCQANRFRDVSSNALAATINGAPSVQPFSPFNPTTPYSTSSIGGSGYFDGSGDELTVPSNTAFNLSSGAWTIEAWVYPTAFSGYNTIISARSAIWEVGVNTGTPNLYFYNGGLTTTSNTLTRNAWNHVAVSSNGTTISLFINGVLGATVNTNPGSTASTVYVGSANGVQLFSGYISNLRVVKGTQVYTAAFTPPTAPLTAITNTSLLLSTTNGAIFDNAAVADYETVGNAQISTSVKKYGTGSMAFDGSGDRLTIPYTNALFDLGVGGEPFTIEAWIYPTNAMVSAGQIFSKGGGTASWSTSSGAQYQLSVFNSAVDWSFNSSGSPISLTSPAITLNTWIHVAVSYQGGVTKLFINGNQVASSTSSYTAPTTRNLQYIGMTQSGGFTQEFYGYIDDFRISKGVGRYPYNFTPPTAEFPNIGGTVTLTADPYFDYTTLLLPGNGTNGAQNNTFLDSSTNNFTITRNGNTTQGTFSPFSQTGWGNYFDGTGDFLTTNATQAIPATGDFTIEAWVYPTVSGPGRNIVSQGTAGTSGRLQLNVHTDNTLQFAITSTIVYSSGQVAPNQWNYVAVTRTGSSVAFYINGSAAGTATLSGTVQNTTLSIGAEWSGDPYRWLGYISNVRISNVVRTITAAPTAPFTSDANTVVLTCQSNRFIDNSTNAFAITRNGDVSVQAFSPFNPTAAWSASTNGGSGYFDGSGDFLTVPNNTAFDFGSGDFTIEGWIYRTVASGYQYFIGKYSGGTDRSFQIGFDTTNVWDVVIHYGSSSFLSVYSGAAPATNQWVHFALERNGANLEFYVNGSRVSQVGGQTIRTSTADIYIGALGNGYTSTWEFDGYISGLRFVKGTAVYSGATYTVPTAPPTAITNTSLLTNFTNAGIYDATSKNDLETVGNAQISTTQSKFGGSSMYFDGTNDGLIGPSTQLASFGTGDFTVESWVYLTTISGADRYLFTTGNGIDTSLRLYIGSTGEVVVYTSFGIRLSSTNPLVVNTWTHVAVCRYNGILAVYLNGVQNGTASYSTAIDCNGKISVGSDNNGGSSMIGYLDDFRVTKGIARYTSNFTPPTTAFLTL